MKFLFSVIFLTLFGLNTASALSLQEAKSAGLVGERNDGYVGYVVTPPADTTKILVKSVNNQRKKIFDETASSNGITIEQVGARFYQRAVNATKPKHYYQDTTGNWQQK